MSLIRQIWLLMLGTRAARLRRQRDGARRVGARHLQTQLRLKNADNATSLALALSQQKGDRELMGLVMSAQFDTGFYRRIRFTAADGKVRFVREAPAAPTATRRPGSCACCRSSPSPAWPRCRTAGARSAGRGA